MHIYSIEYGEAVVQNFRKSHRRGYLFILNIWKRMDSRMVLRMFCYDQVRWNIYKKLVKLADRLLLGGLSEDVVLRNCLKSVKYFQKVAEKELEEWLVRRNRS